MSALAKYLLDQKKEVAGSDAERSVYTAELVSLGVDVEIGNENSDKLLDFDAIVYTDAISEADPRMIAAKRHEKEIISRGQLLYEISRYFSAVIGVSGCHGKTTCTSMLAHIFSAAEKSFTSHIGGRDVVFSNYFGSGNDYFITEACEYKKNFLLLKPDVSVILNSDADHLECYGSLENLKKAYMSFADCANIAVVLYGDLPIHSAVTFGFDSRADFFAAKIKNVEGKYSFCVYENSRPLGEIQLNVYGKHNVLNAVAAIAVARSLSIPYSAIRQGLCDFVGVERRFEQIGIYNGAKVIADYAHHPDEIKAVLRVAKRITSGKLYVIFQPHTYSRTKSLFKRFVGVLSPLKNLLIFKTFAAREYFDDAGSALTLSKSVKKSRYGDSVRDITDFLKNVKGQDTVLVLGAGDIYFVVKNMLKK